MSQKFFSTPWQPGLGLGLFLTKCVPSGKGDSAIDPARTDLLDRIFNWKIFD